MPKAKKKTAKKKVAKKKAASIVRHREISAPLGAHRFDLPDGRVVHLSDEQYNFVIRYLKDFDGPGSADEIIGRDKTLDKVEARAKKAKLMACEDTRSVINLMLNNLEWETGLSKSFCATLILRAYNGAMDMSDMKAAVTAATTLSKMAGHMVEKVEQQTTERTIFEMPIDEVIRLGAGKLKIPETVLERHRPGVARPFSPHAPEHSGDGAIIDAESRDIVETPQPASEPTPPVTPAAPPPGGSSLTPSEEDTTPASPPVSAQI